MATPTEEKAARLRRRPYAGAPDRSRDRQRLRRAPGWHRPDGGRVRFSPGRPVAEGQGGSRHCRNWVRRVPCRPNCLAAIPAVPFLRAKAPSGHRQMPLLHSLLLGRAEHR